MPDDFFYLFPGLLTFQTKPDSKEEPGEMGARLTRVMHGGIVSLRFKVQAYNELGAGVFFSVNETDGMGRRAENITRLRTVVCDFDHGVPDILSVKRTPTVRVESSPGKEQWYWVLEKPVENVPSTLALWKGVQAALVGDLGGDPQAMLVTQILRVPGFRNHKYSPAPLVRVIQGGGPHYTLEQLAQVWKPVEKRVSFLTTPVVDGTALPPEESRQRRYLAWLEAQKAPEAGRGARNGWYYARAAAALRDFAIEDAGWVVDVLTAHSERHHGSAAYDYNDVARIVRNAARSATAQIGRAVAKPSFVPTIGVK